MPDRRVLLIDSDAHRRAVSCAALTAAGFQTSEAVDVETALASPRLLRARIVFQDLASDAGPPAAVVTRLREAFAERVCVIAVVPWNSVLDHGRLLAQGFDDAIFKPCAPERWAQRAEAHLPHLSQAVSKRPNAAAKLALVVDDDPIQLRLMAFRLSVLGFSVCEARSGEEALGLARERKPGLVVSDVLMPEQDGFGLVRALRAEPSLVHARLLLITSARLEPQDRELARQVGAHDLVRRDLSVSELGAVIERTLDEPTRPSQPLTFPPLESELSRSLRLQDKLQREQRKTAALRERCEALSAELSVLARISGAVLRRGDVGAELEHALATCFKAGDAMRGALYLLEQDGSLSTRVLGQPSGPWARSAARAFGQPAWLSHALERSEAQQRLSLRTADPVEQAVLREAEARWGLLSPLCYGGRPRGLLALFANDEESDTSSEHFRRLAHGLNQQIALSLTLVELVSELEAAEREARSQRRAAQEQAALWQALVEHAPDVVMNLDREGTVQFANRGWAADRGAPLLGQSWFQLALPEYRPVREAALRAVLSTGRAMSIESVLATSGAGPRWVESHLGPIVTPEGISGVVVIESDVTQKKQTEAQLIVSDRMASVGTLAAGVAHEINNPLASVMANIDLAVRDLEEGGLEAGRSGDLLEELRDAREGAERVRRIVKDLRIFSRVDEERRGAVDVERVMESTLRMAWNEIRHRARLVKNYGRVPLVEANEPRLGQVFLNLVVNAAQAIEEGNVAENEVRVSTRVNAQGAVEVCVADTGSGIDDAIRERLFTPFVTTKPAGVGTGLGLSICHRIVSSLGGSIEVSSKAKEGTEFVVALPAARDDAFPYESTRRHAVPARRRGRVLVVDDELLIVKAVRRTLGREHQVSGYTDPARALEDVMGGERYDVILCDLMMPELPGMDLHAVLARECAEQADRMVFLTGGAFTARAREFLARVPNKRVEKPIDAEALKSLVNRLVD